MFVITENIMKRPVFVI